MSGDVTGVRASSNASPRNLARAGGVVPSSGASGDLPIDDSLAMLQRAAENFLSNTSESHDAQQVVQAGTDLHEVLQRRLDEAAG